jgi:hypothetical protein
MHGSVSQLKAITTCLKKKMDPDLSETESVSTRDLVFHLDFLLVFHPVFHLMNPLPHLPKLEGY